MGEQVLRMPHKGPGVTHNGNPVREDLGLIRIEDGDDREPPEPPAEQERRHGADEHGCRWMGSSMAIQLDQERVAFYDGRHEESGRVAVAVMVMVMVMVMVDAAMAWRGAGCRRRAAPYISPRLC
jgi:alkanesulfonate monooxygenase SsuD/methylene tetrahydromethanopterin reductase-like flavin-dependent oxidoreductase (luciferase family)